MENHKYPENYFEQYIVSFSTTGQTADEVGFEKLARLYIDIEGFDTFSKLIKEIKLIDESDDWSYFEHIIEDYEIEGLDIEKLKEMANTAVKVYQTFEF